MMRWRATIAVCAACLTIGATVPAEAQGAAGRGPSWRPPTGPGSGTSLPPIRDLGVNRLPESVAPSTGTTKPGYGTTPNNQSPGSTKGSTGGPQSGGAPGTQARNPFEGDLSLAVPTQELRNRWHYGRAGHF